MHCHLCGHGPVVNGVCATCHGRAGWGPGAQAHPARPGFPPLLWLPVAAFGLTALLGLITFVTVASGGGSGYPTYDSYGTYGYAGGALAGAVGLFVAVGAGVVALRLAARRPAARAFALIGSVAYLLCSMFDGEVRSAATVLPALLCVGTAVTLAVAPSLRACFAPPGAPPPRMPTSIVVTRTFLAVSGAGLVVGALFYLVGAVLALTLGASASRAGGEIGSLFGGAFSALGGVALVGALLSAGVAVLLFWARQAVGARSRVARVLVTVFAGLDLFVLLLFFAAGVPPTTWLVGFVFNVAAAGALWFPADARRHFGEPPMPAVEQARVAIVDLPRYLPSIAAVSPASPVAPAGLPIPAPRSPGAWPSFPGGAGPVPPGAATGFTSFAPPATQRPPATPAPANPVPPAAAPSTATSSTAALSTAVPAQRSGRHAAVEPSAAGASSRTAAAAAFDPPTECFAAVTPASAAVPDEPPTQPVPVVGAGQETAGTDT